MNWSQHLEVNQDHYIKELCQFISIASVSTDPLHRSDMDKACQWLCNWASSLGLKAEIWPTPGHPCVYIETPPIAGQPVLLIYGHYDVQPAEDLELWTNPPFSPTIHQDRLYGRGASDNKGQIWSHCAAIQSLLTTGQLSCQVKILIEGEEEIGSPSLPNLLHEHSQQLQADFVLVSDTSTAVKGIPTLHYSLRGIIIFEVHLTVAQRDVHSGVFGGTSPNATHRLSQLINQLHDHQGKVTIPGFYDHVLPISPREQDLLNAIPFDAEGYRKFIGCEQLEGEMGYNTNARRWFRPTLDCNGLGGGYQGSGSKTIIPARAWAKFSARLVANQKPEELMEICRRWFLAQTWAGKIDFRADHGGPPYLLDPDGPMASYIDKARQALLQAWQHEPLLVRHGGAIPIVSQFHSILGLSTLLMGFGSPDDAIHSPNEKFELHNFRRALHSSCYFISSL